MQAKKQASCDAISLVEDAVSFTVYQWIKDKASLDQSSHVLFLNYSKSDRDTEFPSAAENKVEKSTWDKNWAETWVELCRAAEKQPNIHSLFVTVSLCPERCIWLWLLYVPISSPPFCSVHALSMIWGKLVACTRTENMLEQWQNVSCDTKRVDSTDETE